MKKICMLFCMLFFILSEAVAVGPLVDVKDFSCAEVVNKKIFGSFQVNNLTVNYYDRLSYVLHLIPDENFKDSSTLIMSSAESKAIPFSLMPNEEKFIAYEFKYPNNMPYGQYTLILSIYDASDKLYVDQEIDNFLIGKKESEYIIPANGQDTNYYKIKDYELPLSGPSVEADGTLKGYINISSTFKQDKKIIPQYSVFKRNLSQGQYILREEDKPILIKSGKSKEVEVNLPIIKEPGAYFVKVRFLDEDNKLISGEYYFRYVVKGESALVSTIGTSFNTKNNILKVYIGYLGAADGSTLKDYVFSTGVKKTRNGDIIEMFADKEDIYATSYENSYSLELSQYDEPLTVWASIGKGDKKLSEYEMIITKDMFENDVLKFEDLIGTKYENYVKALESYRVVSGYPDGTFRADKTLTRAELTSIALNMKKINLNDYEVKTNHFNDVSKEHWAYKTINYAAENGIVNGYGNGLFKPDSEVKYSEALTILINVAGYGENVNELSEKWPDNYITFAKKWNIDDNTSIEDYSKVASRGEVAIMTLNTYYLRED